ncbi:MAG TPA: F0F1 ATP synthase subunit B [Nitrospirales bacterium]|jgi:F-type H+-transporting ATPase subunit b|nr:F0F1 ATP synthase subunit B [Nitrospirales bacterium]
MPQFDTHFFSSLIFWEIVSFAVLLFILAKYAFPPILQILDERERKIRESIESAERRSAEAERRMAEYEAKMKASQKEAEEMVAQAKVRAQQMKEENERQLQADAERIKTAAAREIEQERRKAIEDVRRYASDLALQVAGKVLERSLTDADHQRLADEALSSVAKDYEKT